MMRHASNHGDPYDYPYREPYSYREHREPGGYRDPPNHRNSSSYWDPHEYREPHSHREHREPPHYREHGGHRAASSEAASHMRPVGNITNSDDFASKDSRLFVGNLNTVVLSKEDVTTIFGRLGNVTGISMHKGYAFVQFSSPGEARRALALENGQMYAGQALDLNIVSQPKAKGMAPKRGVEPPPHDGYKRASLMEDSMGGGPAAKRPRSEGNASMQRGNLVTLANSEGSRPSSYSSRPGSGGGAPRRGTEPPEVGCAQCDAVFTSAWSLCLHFQQRHNMTIFRTRVKDGR
ncbi:uncharacterized protein LOC143300835 [Babylonia areolata]|uniref:uncharacterized protein LOC143300835 n=1 Tax=Babylonia areolata TaxID=304850 RepID=UPI003FD42ADB